MVFEDISASQVGLVLATGLFSALATQGLAWIREWMGHKKEYERRSRYAAAQIVARLDAFSIACVYDMLHTEIFILGTRRENWKWPEKLSIIFNKDIEWNYIKPDIYMRAFDICNSLSLLRNKSDLEYADISDQFFTEIDLMRTRLVGLEAWKLSQEVRKIYKLPPPYLGKDVVNIERTLKDKSMFEPETKDKE